MPELEVYPGLVAACGIRYTDPKKPGAKKARRWSPIMGLAVWSLARHIDPRGVGRVCLAELQRAALELWTRDTFYRSMRDAERLGLVRRIVRHRDGTQMVTCAGLAKVAARLELPNVGARKVSLSLASLKTAKSFKSALWSAWHAGRTRKTAAPITRGKLRQLSGMAESTQRAYEARTCDPAGYRVTGATPNAIVLAEPSSPDGLAGPLAAAREHVHGGCYIDRHTGMLLRPIGNSYTSTLMAGSRSRARKTNRFLSHRPGELLPPGSPKRLFYTDSRHAEQAARAGRAEDVPLVPTGRQAASGAVLWRPVYDSWSLAHVGGVV